MNTRTETDHPTDEHPEEPRREYVAMARASFARIVERVEEIAEEIAVEGEPRVDVPEEVGALVYDLWHRIAEADGFTEARERAALEAVIAGDEEYAGLIGEFAFKPPAWSESRLVRLAETHPVAHRHLMTELEALGFALASVDRTFDHAELDAIHAFLREHGA